MRYNRSLFTVYSFITRHLFQFCTKKVHLRAKTVLPPFFAFPFFLLLLQNQVSLNSNQE